MSSPRFRAFRFEHPDVDSAGPSGMSIAPTGGVAMAEGHASVRQAILLLLSTIPGERVMRPEYGCDLFRLMFSPNDDSTAGLAIHYVRRALRQWEPRIDLLDVDAGRDDADPGRLVLLLRYRVRATQRLEEFRLPVDLQTPVAFPASGLR